MNYDDVVSFREVLFDFVKRAAEKDATAEEVQALPAVAQVLAELLR